MRYNPKNVYLVEFKNQSPAEFYHQLKSIYKFHAKQEIGCTLGHLYDNKISPGNPYKNKKVTISLIEIR